MPNLQLVLDLVIAGISLGGIYALLAFALSLTLATTHVLNIAHGSFVVLGAALATLLIRELSVNWLLSVILVVASFSAVGAIFEIVVVRPLVGASKEQVLIGSILITFGLALVIEALLGFYWARLVDPSPTFSLAVPFERFSSVGISIAAERMLILAIVTAAIVVLHLFLRSTALGKVIRALAENHEGALILGVNPRKVSISIYVICFALTASSGMLIVMALPLDPYSGVMLTLTALTVVVIGGVGSLPGALIGGSILGVVEVATAYLLGSIWSPVISVLTFFLVLLLRPQGVLGASRP